MEHQQQTIRSKPLGELSYYYQRAFFRKLFTEFFNRMRVVEKLPTESIEQELIAMKHPLVEYLYGYFQNTIRLELSKAKENREFTPDDLEKILLVKDEVWLADRR